MAFTTIDEGLEVLGKHEKALIQLGHSTLSAAGGALYTIDFYVMGAVKRGLAVTAGFRRLIGDRNLVCAGALLRMQLETALRFFGLSLLEHPHDAALELMGGSHMRRMKSRDGHLLRDAYLVDQLSHRHPWVKSVYAETSAFVHFTEKQIFAGLIDVNDEERSFQMLVATDDTQAPESAFLEALDAFDAATTLLGELISSWQEAKGQLSARDAV